MTDIVVPGDLIGASEEYLAEEGTYEERGKIFAAITGKVEINKEDRTVRVLPVMKAKKIAKLRTQIKVLFIFQTLRILTLQNLIRSLTNRIS
jgi:exosome complex RNA-binding protein Csl4